MTENSTIQNSELKKTYNTGRKNNILAKRNNLNELMYTVSQDAYHLTDKYIVDKEDKIKKNLYNLEESLRKLKISLNENIINLKKKIFGISEKFEKK
jgi:hypothetical protein